MRYLRTFLKRWYLYLIPLLILPAVVTYYGYTHLLLYQSTALLWVDKPVYLSSADFAWSSYLTPAQNEAVGMNELLQSETFVVGVAADTDLAKSVDLTSRFGKDAVYNRIAPEVAIAATGTGSHVLVVSVTDKSPTLALQIVQALMTQFTSEFQTHRLQLDQQAIAFYQQQLTSMQAQVAQDSQKVSDYLHTHPAVLTPQGATDPYLAQLEQQLTQDQQQAGNLSTQIAGLRQDSQATTTASPDIFRVLDPPQMPLGPTLPKRKLLTQYTGGGLAAAVALVALIVAGLTQLDRKVYSIADLRAIGDDMEVDLPPVEAIPVIARIGRGEQRGDTDREGIDGILMPVLTALPRMEAARMQRELREAATVQGQVLPDGPYEGNYE
jgi:uncharacterized protein involved in exopolysaccharide biosynthesis